MPGNFTQSWDRNYILTFARQALCLLGYLSAPGSCFQNMPVIPQGGQDGRDVVEALSCTRGQETEDWWNQGNLQRPSPAPTPTSQTPPLRVSQSPTLWPSSCGASIQMMSLWGMCSDSNHNRLTFGITYFTGLVMCLLLHYSRFSALCPAPPTHPSLPPCNLSLSFPQCRS